MSMSEGIDWLTRLATIGIQSLRAKFGRMSDPWARLLGWAKSRKKWFLAGASMLLLVGSAYGIQQSFLTNSNPENFLAEFAADLDTGDPKVLQNEVYFSDAKSEINLIPAEFQEAFEPIAISNNIEIVRDDEGGFVFKAQGRGPYSLESYDVFEFPIFVRHWKIVNLNAAVLKWSQSNADPQQQVSLGSRSVTVGDLLQSKTETKEFRVSPFGIFKYSVSGYGFNKAIVDREVKLTSGAVALGLWWQSVPLPETTIDSATSKARTVVASCMELQARGKSDCALLSWDPNDDRNKSDDAYGDFKDESIVAINWKLNSCNAEPFFGSATAGSLLVHCDGYRTVKTRYEENECYDKKVFGIYVYGCWGLRTVYGTSSEWFTSVLEVPISLDESNGNIVVLKPKG